MREFSKTARFGAQGLFFVGVILTSINLYFCATYSVVGLAGYDKLAAFAFVAAIEGILICASVLIAYRCSPVTLALLAVAGVLALGNAIGAMSEHQTLASRDRASTSPEYAALEQRVEELRVQLKPFDALRSTATIKADAQACAVRGAQRETPKKGKYACDRWSEYEADERRGEQRDGLKEQLSAAEAQLARAIPSDPFAERIAEWLGNFGVTATMVAHATALLKSLLLQFGPGACFGAGARLSASGRAAAAERPRAATADERPDVHTSQKPENQVDVRGRPGAHGRPAGGGRPGSRFQVVDRVLADVIDELHKRNGRFVFTTRELAERHNVAKGTIDKALAMGEKAGQFERAATAAGTLLTLPKQRLN